ncbi:MAG: hypothetical protein JTT11_03980 [Candidatus Brockarchaeota archaeon]|nr:hypothetical protein [Candidatus Brockarchaeota archaeon]
MLAMLTLTPPNKAKIRKFQTITGNKEAQGMAPTLPTPPCNRSATSNDGDTNSGIYWTWGGFNIRANRRDPKAPPPDVKYDTAKNVAYRYTRFVLDRNFLIDGTLMRTMAIITMRNGSPISSTPGEGIRLLKLWVHAATGGKNSFHKSQMTVRTMLRIATHKSVLAATPLVLISSTIYSVASFL